MTAPKCFVAVYGDPTPPNKSTVESGQYDPDPRYAPFEPRPGDVLLLYCTGSYSGHSMQIPGIGIVLSVDNTWIRYRWLPFTEPISKSVIDHSFAEADLRKFANIRFSSH